MPFGEHVRTRVLLWCDRHCCLCKKACGVNIEVHHIVPEAKGGSNGISNAIPLCFDCHSEVVRYSEDHPLGTKYKRNELTARRDQVFEEFTRHLVPPVDAQISQTTRAGGSRTFPDVGFTLAHLGDSLPVRVRVVVQSLIGGAKKTLPSDLYSGKKLWNLNPRKAFWGHFEMPAHLIPDEERLELRVTLTVVDRYAREHPFLPTGFVWQPEGKYWYAEP